MYRYAGFVGIESEQMKMGYVLLVERYCVYINYSLKFNMF